MGALFREFITLLSNWAIPFLLFVIPIVAFIKKVNVYEVFVDGAKEGFDVAIMIIPLPGCHFGLHWDVPGIRCHGFVCEDGVPHYQPDRFSGGGSARGHYAAPFRKRYVGLGDGTPQNPRTGFLYWTTRFHHLRLNRNDLLRHCRLLWCSGNQKNPSRGSGRTDG